MLGEYDAGYKSCIDSMVRQMNDMKFRIDCLHAENAKLRKLLSSALIVAGFSGRKYLDEYLSEEEDTTLWQELKGLGIEVDA